MSLNPDEFSEPRTDQGVPVGSADAEQDRLNASDDDQVGDDETFLNRGAEQEDTDEGVPVGQADAEQDRVNSAEAGESSM